VINKTTMKGISIKSRVKAGGMSMQHNQTAKGLRLKSRVKAGVSFQDFHFTNHNQAVKGLRVKSGVKAGISVSRTQDDSTCG
jgi:hypothetical protein